MSESRAITGFVQVYCAIQRDTRVLSFFMAAFQPRRVYIE